MCGIVGFLDLRATRVDASQLEGMVATLAHRGPDGQGIHCENGVGLGHRRLSIIDLEGGHQPMSTPDGKLWITFNGEVFNYLELRDELIKSGHTLRTHSDTEVILHLYEEEGEDCVQRLNGQWAFAIWDATRRKLFLSRDRMGVRPLYYTHAANFFLFASEIKALFAHPEVDRELDLQALDQTFTFWFPLPPRTAFRRISQLPPGHSLVLHNGRCRTYAYWHLEYSSDNAHEGDGDNRQSQELLALLQDATRLRLRSDVPVGAYLSGGLDSTVTAALAKKLVGDRLRTFSIGFEDADFDESSYQREASAYLDTQHSAVYCSYEDIARAFPEVIWHTEQPIVRTAPVPMFLLSKLVRDSGYKVVLTGEGADETMGGYDIFKEAKIRRFWGQDLASARRPLLLKRLYPYMQGIQQQSSAYLRRFFSVTPQDLASPFFSHLPRWQLSARIKTFLAAPVRAELQSFAALSDLARTLPDSFAAWDGFNQAEYLEARYLLPEFILSAQGDRMAMAHGVEARHPFLDHRVIEFAAGLSPRTKMRVLDEKHLLKHAARGLVPESIRRRPKQPYRAPDGKSFGGHAAGYVREVLSPGKLKRQGLFDPQAVAALLAKFASGRTTSTADNMALMAVTSTAILHELFIRRNTPADVACTRAR